MKTKQLNIVALFLTALFIFPSIWQLQHVFNNNHGIIYHQNETKIQNLSEDCFLSHQPVFSTFLININPINFCFNKTNSELIIKQTQKNKNKNYFKYLLRAPPVS